MAATNNRDPRVTMMYAALALHWQQLAAEIEKQKKQK
jgi:hypothetical protein